MADTMKLAKAELHEMQADFKDEKSGGKQVKVQFNPETLKLSYSNQSTSTSGGDKSSTKPKQFVGGGSIKLSLQLWFDVTSTASLPEGKEQVDDVRLLTSDVVYFITQQENVKPPVPPGMRFIWGSFKFEGVVESLEESLEFFSHDGKPLRASMSLSMSGQKLLAPTPSTGAANSGGGPGGTTPGTTPMTAAPGGSNLQNLAASIGGGVDWQSLAAANGIDNPRLLQTGQLLNLNAGITGSFGASISASAGVGGSLSVSGSLGADSSIGVSGSLSAGIS
ncbi:MAG TPA: LysM peptidoglycan-binding domain-containing protein [Ktedonobacteraceae bacterium]|nr:LysM peptidoglycan-binding domain-containing protein [Ktedonobacteraceae bacterium]